MKAVMMAKAEQVMLDAAREFVHSEDADRQHPGGETKRTIKAQMKMRRAAVDFVRAMDDFLDTTEV